MEDNRKILYEKASQNLPSLPKEQDDYYLAILPHDKNVQSCEWKDFMWLKVKGKTAISKLRKTYLKMKGSHVSFVDGDRILDDDVVAKTLDHYKSDLVAAWTVDESEGRAPLGERSLALQNVLSKSSSHSNASIKDNNQGAMFSGGSQTKPISKYERTLMRALDTLYGIEPNFRYKFENRTGVPTIICSDCPEIKIRAALQESIKDVVERIKGHMKTASHQGKLRKRCDLVQQL